MRILIIEDDKKTAESICKGIAAAGFETVCAHDGEAGLAEAENIVPKIEITATVSGVYQIIR